MEILDSSETLGENSPLLPSSIPLDVSETLDKPSKTMLSPMGAGLANLGNTCFLNAVLQCFTHTVPLVQSLRSCDHATPCTLGTGGFCVLCTLRDHIELSLASSGGIVSPRKLVENLSHLSSSFQRYEQEDAHEFLQCMLNCLHKCYLDSNSQGQSTSSQDDSFVKQIFGGRLRSQLQCCNCGHSSDTFEPLIDLSLDIKDVDTLSNALKSFTKVEKIGDPQTKFTCESCKVEVSVEKQLTLDQVPEVVTLHLKRFKSNGSYIEKIDTSVQYPLELDLRPFLSNSNDNNEELQYKLYAVVVHIGFSSDSGHYICFIRSSPQTWNRLDDSKVMSVSEESVLSQEAYILFYARQGSPWFSSLMETQQMCLESNSDSTSPKSVLDTTDWITSKSHKSLLDNTDRIASTSPKSVLGNTDRISIPLAVREGDHNSPVSEATDALDFRPLTPTNRCSSPETTSELPFQVKYQIPRDHLALVDRKGSKKAAHNPLEDGPAKESMSRLLMGMPSSRRSGLMACIASSSRGCYSEGSLNRNKRQKVKGWAYGEAISPTSVTRPTLNPRSIMSGLADEDTHLLPKFKSH
ncbi:ubiquitin carboxyl-terminal hydrolase 21-like [Tasmannia lanceolata]|uniref:ubiquitin carboxyl-terminal hydrolase 21-like n=1 Tax=Tasmannia lanceolata TaxID=3420 RepID=UPI004063B4F2